MKKEFKEKIEKLSKDSRDYNDFLEKINKRPPKYIRVNTLKIKPEELEKRLKEKGWGIEKIDKETFRIKNLNPGELGKSREHLLGYYYIQSLTSQLPIKVLNPQPNEKLLDLCASPGSKTTHASQYMNNEGLIIANDKDSFRVKNMNFNINRCGCTNVISTSYDGANLTKELYKKGIKFDKILLDMPCSAEGTSRKNPKILKKWNKNKIKKLHNLQLRLSSSSIKLLKEGGQALYSTCTYSPEENEDIVNELIKRYDLKIEKIKSPITIKTRNGLTKWKEKEYSKELKKAIRIYPQDNNTEGFFLAKLKKME